MINVTFKNFHTRKYTIRKIKRRRRYLQTYKSNILVCGILKTPYKSVRKDKQIEQKGG